MYNILDKKELEALKEKSWKIGGESSGHIVCLDKTTTGDGIVSALQVLCSMIKQETSLRELVQGMELVPQRLINVKTTQAKALMKNKRVMDSVKQCNHVMENQGRVLLRPSGTEPLLRIMVEGFDAQKVDEQAEILRQVIVEAQG